MDDSVRRIPRSGWRWLLVLLICQVLLSILYTVVVPPLEKEDEAIHWDYVRYLRTSGLPDQRDLYVQQNAGELHQPPLYYLVAALLTGPIPFSEPSILELPTNEFGLSFHLQAVPDNANGFLHNPADLALPWHGDFLSIMLLRLLGVVFSIGAVVALFWTAWLVFENEWWALGAAAWLGLRPGVINLNAHVSNDPLVMLTGALVVMVAVLMLVRGITWRRSVLLGGLVGLMVLSKYTSAATVLAVPLVYVMAPGVARQWRVRIGQFTAAVASGLAVAGWWFVRNIVLYGDVSGLSLGGGGDQTDLFLPFRQNAPDFSDLGYYSWKAFREYWALFSVRGLPPWGNAILITITALLLIGLLLLMVRRRTRHVVRQGRAGLFVLIVSGLYGVQLLVMYLVLTNGLKARFTYPGFSAMALLMQLGVIGLLDALQANTGLMGKRLHRAYPLRPSDTSPLQGGGEAERRPQVGARTGGGTPTEPADSPTFGWHRWSAFVPAGLLIALSLYGGLGVLRPSYDLPHRVDDPAQLADQISTPLNIQFGDSIRLAGYDAEAVMHPGDGGTVTLCWESFGPTATRYAYGLHIVNADLFKAVERNTHPGLGMYPTTTWEPGAAFCDRARIDIDRLAPAPEVYNITLRFFDPETLERLPVTLDGEPMGEEVAIGQMVVLPRHWPEPGAVQYRVGDTLAITDLRLVEDTLEPGDPLRVQVEWLTVEAIGEDYTAFVHVFGPDGTFITQADQPPLGGRFPTRVWPRGAVVRDTIEASLAAEAAPGSYRIVFGMYRSATAERLPLTTADGVPLPDNLVTIGTVDVR